MRESRTVLAVLGIAVVLSLPVLGTTMTVQNEDVAAHALTRGELTITLLPPLAKRTDIYGGAVIPVRMMLKDPDEGGLAGANATVWVNDKAATSPGDANSNNTMRDLGGGLYIYNLNTKPYPAGPGSQPIKIIVLAKAPDDRFASVIVSVSLD